MIAALFVPLLVQSAEPPVAGWNCDDPQVQQEMNWCAQRDFEIADERLNAQWKETAVAMKAQDADYVSYGSENDTREGWFASLLESQRGWLRYRDAQCRAEGYKARGGSLESLLALTCKSALTQARTQQLRALAQGPK